LRLVLSVLVVNSSLFLSLCVSLHSMSNITWLRISSSSYFRWIVCHILRDVSLCRTFTNSQLQANAFHNSYCHHTTTTLQFHSIKFFFSIVVRRAPKKFLLFFVISLCYFSSQMKPKIMKEYNNNKQIPFNRHTVHNRLSNIMTSMKHTTKNDHDFSVFHIFIFF
jgi:hypothetical protein